MPTLLWCHAASVRWKTWFGHSRVAPEHTPSVRLIAVGNLKPTLNTLEQHGPRSIPHVHMVNAIDIMFT